MNDPRGASFRFAASLDQHADGRKAMLRCAADVRRQLQSDAVDLAVVFVTPQHCEEFAEMVAALQGELACRRLLGCAAESVVSGEREIEGGPAVSLWAAVLPGVDIETFHIRFERTPDGIASEGLPAREDLPGPVQATLLFGDPFSCPASTLIDLLAEEHPGAPLLGGMASAAGKPGENRLVRDDEITNFGGVGAFLSGPVRVRSLVSQGCRPIGQRFVVTRSDDNLIIELGGRPALERLREVYADLADDERRLFQRGPHVGLALTEYKDDFRRGDFLIASLLGADEGRGAVAIGSSVRTGQTIQFHVRDSQSADEDLRNLLGSLQPSGAVADRGGLLFTCNGRGTRMFDEPHHDAATVQKLAGPLPLAGFFAQGELGPVGGKNHVHGFTASLAIFEPAE